MNLQQELNEPQYQAVTTTEGSVLVIAGAGSGKTRTLVYRVAALIEKGVPPEQILLLTFTRKASQEMLWRAGKLMTNECSRVVGGTFHSTANILLRRFGYVLGFEPSFTIIDRADAEGIVNLLKSSLGVSKKEKQFPTKRVIINMISGSVNRSIPLETLIEKEYSHLLEHLETLLALAEHYKTFKFEHGLMDYDDLLINWNLLLDNKEVHEKVSTRFQYIMVDEYQDTNIIQAEIVKKMAAPHGNVMAVGDDSQSIYSFRGADFYNIIRFPEIFKDTVIIKLEENYRSTQPILSLTNNIITNATQKYTKSLFSNIPGKIKPQVFAGRDEQEEAVFVLQTIKELLAKENLPLHEIAVLFRSGFHSYKFEIELTSEKIEYEKRGGLKLTESAHIKDFISFLRALANPTDTLSWSRILLQLEGVGPATAQKISTAIAESEDWLTTIQNYPTGKNWQEAYKKFASLFERLAEKKEERPALLFEIVDSYYQPVFQRLYRDDYPKRQKDLDQVKALLDSYDVLQNFIDDTTLDPPDEGGNQPEGDKLILSTIHSAKGLEFDAVFIIGLAEGRFPHSAAVFGEGLEEERRLLYVAATRARKFLYMSYPRRLMSVDRQFHRAGMSPFLVEIQRGLYQRADDLDAGLNTDFNTNYKDLKTQKGTLYSNEIKKSQKLRPEQLSCGMRVQHSFFGKGTVQNISGGKSLEIQFDRHGVKKLHLDYAKLLLL